MNNKQNELKMKGNGLSVACLILSIFGFLTGFLVIGILLDIIAIVIGIIILCDKKRDNGLAVAGLIISILGGLFTFLFYTIIGDDNKNNEVVKTAIESKAVSIDSNSNNQNDKIIKENNFNEETVVSQLHIEEYTYESTLQYAITILVVKNNSDFNIDATIKVKELDANGEMIGISESNQNAFESGEQLTFTFMHDKLPDSISYEVSVKEEDFYECAISDLTYEEILVDNKIIVSVTNNGTEPIDFVEATALFFKGDEIIYHTTNYFIDDDNELKPNTTIDEEMNAFETYDSVKIYLSGRRS